MRGYKGHAESGGGSNKSSNKRAKRREANLSMKSIIAIDAGEDHNRKGKGSG